MGGLFERVAAQTGECRGVLVGVGLEPQRSRAVLQCAPYSSVGSDEGRGVIRNSTKPKTGQRNAVTGRPNARAVGKKTLSQCVLVGEQTMVTAGRVEVEWRFGWSSWIRYCYDCKECVIRRQKLAVECVRVESWLAGGSRLIVVGSLKCST